MVDLPHKVVTPPASDGKLTIKPMRFEKHSFLFRRGFTPTPPERETALASDSLSIERVCWQAIGKCVSIVARMNLPLMHYSNEQKLEVFHQAIQGLITLEENPDQQAKYADSVDIYAKLDDNEIKEYAARYPQEEQVMASFADRYRQEGKARGEVKGEAQTLLKLIQLKFGDQPGWVEDKLNAAGKAQLDHWVGAILTASSLEELFRE